MSANAMQVPPVGELEKQFWVVWIGGLSNSDLLDRDEIEDHLHAIGILGSGSLLGVDFGWWTSSDDEQEAIRAAQAEARRMEQQRQAATPSAAP